MIPDLSTHWLEIAAAIYLLGMVLYGHYRGFIRLAVSAASLVISLSIVYFAAPLVTEWVKDGTPLYQNMKEKMVQTARLDEYLEPFGYGEDIQKEDEWEMIESLPIPAQFKQGLIENNNIEVYKNIGVEFFRDYIIEYLASIILKTTVSVVLFFVAFLALQILIKCLDVIAKLPILSGINQIAGAMLGGMEACVVLWIMGLIFTMLSGTKIGMAALEQIHESSWLAWFYNHNLLSQLIFGVIRMI